MSVGEDSPMSLPIYAFLHATLRIVQVFLEQHLLAQDFRRTDDKIFRKSCPAVW